MAAVKRRILRVKPVFGDVGTAEQSLRDAIALVPGGSSPREWLA
jgi:hypothetical protein